MYYNLVITKLQDIFIAGEIAFVAFVAYGLLPFYAGLELLPATLRLRLKAYTASKDPVPNL